MGFNLQAFLFHSILLSEVAAKYCWYSSEGYTKYFYCSSYEYCCGNSCCENFTQFYKLWYFWVCVVLSLVFCSGGGYWYRKRYTHRRILIGQPQTTAVVTMTQSSTASADGTCTRIPTGMTYQPSCGCPQQEAQQIYAPPSYPPPAPAPTPATNPRGTLLLSGVVRITQKGNVIYQTVPCGPPPSYDSILHLAEACTCNCIENPDCQNGEHTTACRSDSHEYVEFCHSGDPQGDNYEGNHATQCPVCEAVGQQQQQAAAERSASFDYCSPATPPPAATGEVSRLDLDEDVYNFREQPKIPSYDDGPENLDLIYNVPTEETLVRTGATQGSKSMSTSLNDKELSECLAEEDMAEGQPDCTCECVQCQSDCHGNCIYGRADLLGCRAQRVPLLSGSRSRNGSTDLDAESSDEEHRQLQIQQLHKQLQWRHQQQLLQQHGMLQRHQERLKHRQSSQKSEDEESSWHPMQQELQESSQQPKLPTPLQPQPVQPQQQPLQAQQLLSQETLQPQQVQQMPSQQQQQDSFKDQLSETNNTKPVCAEQSPSEQFQSKEMVTWKDPETLPKQQEAEEYATLRQDPPAKPQVLQQGQAGNYVILRHDSQPGQTQDTPRRQSGQYVSILQDPLSKQGLSQSAAEKPLHEDDRQMALQKQLLEHQWILQKQQQQQLQQPLTQHDKENQFRQWQEGITSFSEEQSGSSSLQSHQEQLRQRKQELEERFRQWEERQKQKEKTQSQRPPEAVQQEQERYRKELQQWNQERHPQPDNKRTQDEPTPAPQPQTQRPHLVLQQQEKLMQEQHEQELKEEQQLPRQDRQRRQHQKIVQKQAELLEKYKQQWLSKKSK